MAVFRLLVDAKAELDVISKVLPRSFAPHTFIKAAVNVIFYTQEDSVNSQKLVACVEDFLYICQAGNSLKDRHAPSALLVRYFFHVFSCLCSDISRLLAHRSSYPLHHS